MKKLTFAVLIFAAWTNSAFAVDGQGAAALASDHATPGSVQAGTVKRSAGGRMQLEPMKASDFVRRAPPPQTPAQSSEESKPKASQAGKVKRDAYGRMQLEPLKASDFTRLNNSGK